MSSYQWILNALVLSELCLKKDKLMLLWLSTDASIFVGHDLGVHGRRRRR